LLQTLGLWRSVRREFSPRFQSAASPCIRSCRENYLRSIQTPVSLRPTDSRQTSALWAVHKLHHSQLHRTPADSLLGVEPHPLLMIVVLINICLQWLPRSDPCECNFDLVSGCSLGPLQPAPPVILAATTDPYPQATHFPGCVGGCRFAKHPITIETRYTTHLPSRPWLIRADIFS
jgi:hypothetical protein